MEQNTYKILQRQLLLMGYKLKDTLSENIQNINDKSLLNEQGAADRYTNYINSEKGQEQLEKEKENKYPNYCKYPKRALPPPENEFKAVGNDALPIKIINNKIVKFCYYPSPSSLPNGAGIFLPSDSEITFWNTDSDISYALEKWIEKRPNDIEPKGPIKLKNLYQNFKRILKIGTVSSFVYEGKTYRVRLRWEPELQSWEYVGFATKEGNYYQNPELDDPRSEYEKFVDKWGIALQIAGAFATVIAGVLTGGAAWVLTAEIAIELGLGAMVAQREFETGQNISGTFSLIFGMLPMLKLTKYFRGVDEQTFKSLSNKLSKANLNANSTADDYIKFYENLNDEQKKLLTKALEQDEITRNQMFDEISVNLNKLAKSKILESGLKNMVKENPDILENLDFLEKLWARELSTAIGALSVYGIIKLAKGDIWDKDTSEKSAKIYSITRTELKKQLTFILLQNAKQSKKIVENIYNLYSQDKYKSVEIAKTLVDYQEYLLSKGTKDGGGNYEKVKNDNENQDVNIDMNNMYLTEEQIKEQGWIPLGGETINDVDDNCEIVTINEYLYFRKK